MWREVEDLGFDHAWTYDHLAWRTLAGEPWFATVPTLTAAALAADPDLDDFGGRVSDSGEGRWTVLAAVEEGVPANVIQASLNARFSSRDLNEFQDKVQSAMRSQFGGHDEKPAVETA